MDYLINIANILYLFSYLVRDILWLQLTLGFDLIKRLEATYAR